MRLRCAICGEAAFGKQWWNQDKGYGICMKCADHIEKRLGEDELKKSFGIRGVNFKDNPDDIIIEEPDYFIAHSTGEKVPL